MRKQPLPVFRRLAVGLLLLGFIIATLSGVHRFQERQNAEPEQQEQPSDPDPISTELKRCSALTNDEALADKGCRRAWILNRQRFFGKNPELLDDPKLEEEK